MSPTFLAAVIDTILPGEPEVAADGTPLPRGSDVCRLSTERVKVHRPVLELIMDRGGGEAVFVSAGSGERTAVLAAIEREASVPFRRLVVDLLQDYFESATALESMGAHAHPPQPRGRDLAATDKNTIALLNSVRVRGRIWR